MISNILIGFALCYIGYLFLAEARKETIEHRNRSIAQKKAWKRRGFMRINHYGKTIKKIAYKRNPDIKWVSEI